MRTVLGGADLFGGVCLSLEFILRYTVCTYFIYAPEESGR